MPAVPCCGLQTQVTGEVAATLACCRSLVLILAALALGELSVPVTPIISLSCSALSISLLIARSGAKQGMPVKTVSACAEDCFGLLLLCAWGTVNADDLSSGAGAMIWSECVYDGVMSSVLLDCCAGLAAALRTLGGRSFWSWPASFFTAR